MAEQEKILQVKNLQISFRTNNGTVKAVRNISFDLYKGETLSIVGESGSGKSVTNRAILGILANNKIIEGGEIIFDGKDLLKTSEEDFVKIRGSKIAMIFQDPMSSLNPIMHVGKQITEAMLLKSKASRAEAKKLINKVEKNVIKYASEENGDNVAKDFATYHEAMQNYYKKKYEYDYALYYLEKADKALDQVLDVIDLSGLTVQSFSTVCTTYLSYVKASFNEKVVAKESKVAAGTITLQKIIKEAEAGKLTVSGFRDEAKSLLLEARAYIDTLKATEYFDYKYPEFFAVLNHDKEAKYEDLPEQKELVDRFVSTIKEHYAAASKNALEDSKRNLQETLPSASQILESVEILLENKTLLKTVKDFNKQLLSAVNPLYTENNDIILTFSTTISDAIESYYKHLKGNANAENDANKKYERELREAEKDYQTQLKSNSSAVMDEVTKEEPKLYDLGVDVDKIKATLGTLITEIESFVNGEKDEKTTPEILEAYYEKNMLQLVSVVGKSKARDKALELMREVGIPFPEKRFNQYPFQFSGGMRQRIVIAIAIGSNPDILICDEPTTALDVTIQAQILELINKLKRERNLSVIFITHDLGVVANMADRIAVMYAGKIVEYGTADDIFYDPCHPYTWALLSSMPDINTAEKLDAIPGTPPNMIFPPVGDAFAARNKYAMKIDFEKQPPFFKVNDTHYAATWLLHPQAPKVEPPKIVTERIRRMKALIEEGGASDGE